MDKKTKLFIIAQVVIIALFAFLAIGCFGSSYTTDSYYDNSYDNRREETYREGWTNYTKEEYEAKHAAEKAQEKRDKEAKEWNDYIRRQQGKY
ncbi:MAG: hypothetical protein J5542_01545 [Bacteroidales bacterium]|nr:hypothetical protein [Bacteroidales bacterium]